MSCSSWRRVSYGLIWLSTLDGTMARNRDRARSVFNRLNQMRWLINHLNADTAESLLLKLLASRPTKIVLRLLIKSAATLKLAKEDAADASADQERCYAKPMLLLMTRDAARDSR